MTRWRIDKVFRDTFPAANTKAFERQYAASKANAYAESNLGQSTSVWNGISQKNIPDIPQCEIATHNSERALWISN